tara:strand:+ start:239 stop:661 length:423 start_codon:yes stop_codon:yes gene_type:complete
MSKEKDLDFGLNGEKYAQPFIEKYLNITICKTQDKYHSFDFKSDATIDEMGYFIEVKTRNINYNQAKYYKNLFVSKTKIDFINNNPDNNYYFCFNLKDVILIYNYTKPLGTAVNGNIRRGDSLKLLSLLPVKDMVIIHRK